MSDETERRLLQVESRLRELSLLCDEACSERDSKKSARAYYLWGVRAFPAALEVVSRDLPWLIAEVRRLSAPAADRRP